MFCFVLIYYGMILYLNLKKNYFLCTCGTRFQIFSRVAVVHFGRDQPRPISKKKYFYSRRSSPSSCRSGLCVSSKTQILRMVRTRIHAISLAELRTVRVHNDPSTETRMKQSRFQCLRLQTAHSATRKIGSSPRSTSLLSMI